MDRDESHLYRILPDQEYFHVGTLGDGRQVLMGLLCPDLVAITFDRAGNLLGFDTHPLEFLHPQSGIYNIYDERIGPREEAWHRELEFRPATIEVKRFSIDELGVGIDDYPEHFAEVLDEPDQDEDWKAQIRKDKERWEADGQFVLYWGNDYWLDHTGEVVSS